MTEKELQAAFEEHKDAVYRFAWRMMNSLSGRGVGKGAGAGAGPNLHRDLDGFGL